ncbi:MAG: hypothetical protein RTU30_13520, partial [Candidatus Thorarchaeota archaeon]
NTQEFKALPFLLLLVVTIIGAGIVTHMFTGDVFNPYNWLMVIPVVLGMIMFGPSLYLVDKSGSKSYYLFGLFSLLLGLIVSYLTAIFPPTDYLGGTIAFCMILGITLTVVGLSKLVFFLRTNPVLDPQEDEVSE